MRSMAHHESAVEVSAGERRLRSATDALEPSAEDRAILAFVSEQHAVTVGQLVRFFGIYRSDMERFLREYEAAGWLEHREVITDEDSWVWLTHRGDVLSGTGFRNHGPIHYRRFSHYYAITEVRLRIAKHQPDAKWTCERRLRSRWHQGGRTPNIPDGLYEVENGEGVLESWAIEAELSSKSPDRLREIIADHSMRYDVVMYFCSPGVARSMEKLQLEREFSNFAYLELFQSSKGLSHFEVKVERPSSQAGERVLGPWEIGFLNLLAEQGAIPMDQVMRFLGGEKTVVKRRVSGLLRDGFIRCSRPLTAEPDWFWLSEAGAASLRSGLSAMSPRLGGLEKLRFLNEVRLCLEDRWSTVRWESWRVLRHVQGSTGSVPAAVAVVGEERHAIELCLAEPGRFSIRRLFEERTGAYDSLIVFCSSQAYGVVKNVAEAVSLPSLTVERLPGQKFRKRGKARRVRPPATLVMAEISSGDLPPAARDVLRKAHGTSEDPQILSVERRVIPGPPRYRIVTDDGVWQAVCFRGNWRVVELTARYEPDETRLPLGEHVFPSPREKARDRSLRRRPPKKADVEPEAIQLKLVEAPAPVKRLSTSRSARRAFGKRGGRRVVRRSVRGSRVKVRRVSPRRRSFLVAAALKRRRRMMIVGETNAQLVMAEIAVSDLPGEALRSLRQAYRGAELEILSVERRVSPGGPCTFRVVTEAGAWRVTRSKLGWCVAELANRFEAGEERIALGERFLGGYGALCRKAPKEDLVMAELLVEALPEGARAALASTHGSLADSGVISVEKRMRPTGGLGYRVVTEGGVWRVTNSNVGWRVEPLRNRFEPDETRVPLAEVPRWRAEHGSGGKMCRKVPKGGLVMAELAVEDLPEGAREALYAVDGSSADLELISVERRIKPSGAPGYRVVTDGGVWRVTNSRFGWRANELVNRFEPDERRIPFAEVVPAWRKEPLSKACKGKLVMVELFSEELPEEPRRALNEAHGSSAQPKLLSVERRCGSGPHTYRVVTEAGVWWVTHTKRRGSSATELARRFEPDETRFELHHPRAVKQRKAWLRGREKASPKMAEISPSALLPEAAAALAAEQGVSSLPQVLKLERRVGSGPRLYRVVTAAGVWRVSQGKQGWKVAKLENGFEAGEKRLGGEVAGESSEGRASLA